MKGFKMAAVLSTAFLAACVTKYANYIEPLGEDLATLNIKNVGTWYVSAITFNEPNGCTGRMWLGEGSLLPQTEMNIKLQPDVVFSFQIGSAQATVKSSGPELVSYLQSCGPGLARFTPEKNETYELVVGLIAEKNQCIYSFKQKTKDNGDIDIASFAQNEPIKDPWATPTSPLCKKFQ